MFPTELVRGEAVPAQHPEPDGSDDRAMRARRGPLPLQASLEWSLDGCTVSLPVRAEHVTVEKWPVVVEEVVVHTDQVVETAHLTETVRHEEARVVTEGDVHVTDQRAAAPGTLWQR